MRICMKNTKENSKIFKRSKDIKENNLMAIKSKNKRNMKNSSCQTSATYPRMIEIRKSGFLPTPKLLRSWSRAGLVQTSALSTNSKTTSPAFLCLKNQIKPLTRRIIRRPLLQQCPVIGKINCLQFT
jgi:hypothetical protein